MHAHEYFSIATVFLSNYSYEVIVNDDIYNALRTITKEKNIKNYVKYSLFFSIAK